ncbi:MAG: hypothetical protein FWC40_08620 [Proteobacteria bacterium]|nr:hypothetical protein [Pseudomonadota bacterium]
MDSKKFDTRLIERHLEKGMISEADLAAHLEALPDCSGKLVAFSTPQPIVSEFEAEADDEDDSEA